MAPSVNLHPGSSQRITDSTDVQAADSMLMTNAKISGLPDPNKSQAPDNLTDLQEIVDKYVQNAEKHGVLATFFTCLKQILLIITPLISLSTALAITVFTGGAVIYPAILNACSFLLNSVDAYCGWRNHSLNKLQGSGMKMAQDSLANGIYHALISLKCSPTQAESASEIISGVVRIALTTSTLVVNLLKPVTVPDALHLKNTICNVIKFVVEALANLFDTISKVYGSRSGNCKEEGTNRQIRLIMERTKECEELLVSAKELFDTVKGDVALTDEQKQKENKIIDYLVSTKHSSVINMVEGAMPEVKDQDISSMGEGNKNIYYKTVFGQSSNNSYA